MKDRPVANEFRSARQFQSAHGMKSNDLLFTYGSVKNDKTRGIPSLADKCHILKGAVNIKKGTVDRDDLMRPACIGGNGAFLLKL